MNRITKIAIKDLKLLLRDKLGAFFIFGFPILMGVFFGMMYPGPSSGTTKSKMSIIVVDHDDTEMSQKLVESLEGNGNIAVQRIGSEQIDALQKNETGFSREDAEIQVARDQVRLGRCIGMIMIPKGFGERAGVFWGEPPDLRVGMDDSRGAEKAMVEGFLMEAMGSLFAKRFENPTSFLPDIDEARKQIAEDKEMDAGQKLLFTGFLGTVESMIGSVEKLRQDTDEGEPGQLLGDDGLEFVNIVREDVTRKVNASQQLQSRLRSKWDISFPQAMLWGVLGCVAGFAISIAKERSAGTMVRLQVAPIAKFEVLLGKAFACFLAVLMVIALMVALGYFLGMRPLSYSKLVVASLCVATCFVGIMMTMSVLGKTEQSVNGSGWAINMVMAMLGGGMIPVMFMPQMIRQFSFLSPVRWGIQAIEGAVWRDFSWLQLLTPCGILVGIGCVGLVLGTAILNRTNG